MSTIDARTTRKTNKDRIADLEREIEFLRRDRRSARNGELADDRSDAAAARSVQDVDRRFVQYAGAAELSRPMGLSGPAGYRCLTFNRWGTKLRYRDERQTLIRGFHDNPVYDDEGDFIYATPRWLSAYASGSLIAKGLGWLPPISLPKRRKPRKRLPGVSLKVKPWSSDE